MQADESNLPDQQPGDKSDHRLDSQCMTALLPYIRSEIGRSP